jgi:hypothetical protein
MKNILLLSILGFLAFSAIGQNSNWLKYYLKGSKAITNKSYEEGIRLLTIWIQELPSADAYVTRAAAYSATGDTCISALI